MIKRNFYNIGRPLMQISSKYLNNFSAPKGIFNLKFLTINIHEITIIIINN